MIYDYCSVSSWGFFVYALRKRYQWLTAFFFRYRLKCFVDSILRALTKSEPWPWMAFRNWALLFNRSYRRLNQMDRKEERLSKSNKNYHISLSKKSSQLEWMLIIAQKINNFQNACRSNGLNKMLVINAHQPNIKKYLFESNKEKAILYAMWPYPMTSIPLDTYIYFRHSSSHSRTVERP